MGKHSSDKSTPDLPSPDSVEKEKALVRSMMDELGSMSVTEMTEALESLASAGQSASPEAELLRVSLDEIYGSSTAKRPSEPEQSTRGDVMEDHNNESKSALETPDSHSPDVPVSGIVRDEIVTALLQAGVVTTSQVSDAMKRREDDQELWRALEEDPALDMSTIRAAVAAQRGISSQAELDIPPTRAFVHQILEAVSPVDLARFLGVGLLPVHLDMDMDMDWVEHSLTVLSADPLDRRVQSVLLSSPVTVTCGYAPESIIADALAQFIAWMRDDGYEVQAVTSTDRGGSVYAPPVPPSVPPPAPPIGPDGLDEDDPYQGDAPWPSGPSGGGSGQGASREAPSMQDPTQSSASRPGPTKQGPTKKGPTKKIDSRPRSTQRSSMYRPSLFGSGMAGSSMSGSSMYGGSMYGGSNAFGSGTSPEIGLSNWSESEVGEEELSKINVDRVVRHLLAEEAINETQLTQAKTIAAQQEVETTLWRVVADLPSVDREYVYETAATIYAFRKEIVGPGKPEVEFVLEIMEPFKREQRDTMIDMLLVPFEYVQDGETGTSRLILVTPDPTRSDINQFVQELNLGRFELRYASEHQVTRFYEDLFPRKNEYLERISTEMDAYDLGMTYEDDDAAVDEEELEAEISRSKLINLFEAALVEATRLGVSDIHIYPNPNRQVEIHFRLDGRLKLWHTEDKVHPEAFLAVVKDNSTNVDRFERDAAQDGFIQRRIDGALIRFRVSILPIATANQEVRAESIVIRILDDRKVLTDITKLGMLDVALDNFNKAIRQPHGMVILTGPTGSGKSTTLVAALHQVITPEVNVLTVEDPVEYVIRGVRQIKLSHKLHLEGALRAILRHDPDIVMVGEMRDRETAELAIKLANTGHLTFSTLHTNSAPAAVARLYKMGVEPFLIAYAINLIVAQRLIRVLCPDCKAIDPDPDRVMMHGLGWSDEEIDSHTIYEATLGAECRTCRGLGYKGRRAVCETLYFTSTIRTMIAESADAIDEDAIREEGLKNGMLTLAASARILVNEGVTTVDEMMRMTSMD